VRRGSKGGGCVPATGVQEGEGKLIRELRRGDVVLMALLAREEKGWNFGSTGNRTAAGSEITGPVCWAARAGGGRRAGQEGSMRCGSAGGAQNWRGGAAEAADGGGQRSSGEVVMRGKEQECGCARGNRRREKFTGRVPELKRGTRGVASSCWWSTARVTARAGSGAMRPCEEEPAWLGERWAGELGARWHRKSGERAAGG
jgi:hypothetical protein